MTSSTIQQRLRAETGAAHQQLEDRLQIGEWLEDRGAYRELLERFHGIYAGLEEKLEPLLAGLEGPLEWGRRRKLPLLERDLRALGASREEIAALPVCHDLPVADSPEQALGIFYVMEGSTLGGQYISKMVAEKLGLGAENGAAFFHAYGPETGAMWKRFGEVLTGAAATTAIEDEMIAAADETFRCFEQWLCARMPT